MPSEGGGDEGAELQREGRNDPEIQPEHRYGVDVDIDTIIHCSRFRRKSRWGGWRFPLLTLRGQSSRRYGARLQTPHHAFLMLGSHSNA